MSDEPTTPAERASFIVRRIRAAMKDFEAMHPRLPDTPKRHGDPSHLGQDLTPVYVLYETNGRKRLRSSGARRVPSSEVDWTLDGERQRECAAELASCLSLYTEGRASLGDVKAVYQRFADAHLVFWLDGRAIYDERAAEIASYERIRMLAEAADTATLAHTTGTVAKPRRGPRLAYSRGRAPVND